VQYERSQPDSTGVMPVTLLYGEVTQYELARRIILPIGMGELELGRGRGSVFRERDMMRKGTAPFIALVCIAAAAAAAGVHALEPAVPPNSFAPVLLLSSLAIMAELLTFLLARSAAGSIAFIPYLAAVFIVPNWITLVAVSGVRVIVELRGRSIIKSVFNVAQHLLATALAVFIYRALGGVSLLQLRDYAFVEASLRAGLPALVACWSSFVINSSLVSGVISVSSGVRFRTVWRDNFRSTIGFDLMAGPVIIVFAWVYASYGPIAAATVWVPILGLRQVQKANLDLEQTNRELLELMVKSIEARDPYTSGHSRRVQHYSTVIARAIGLNERETERIGQAALLHDIGKIYDKYAPILRKADKLSADEWTTMQEHPIDGASLVATMSGLKDIVPAVRHHHENWDGTGYPDGLAGENIPLAARVITLADTIDAMMSERPYRRALTETHVRAELIRCRGMQFDPSMADRLLSSPLWKTLFASATQSSTPRKPLSLVRGASARESA
jgi:putative nucleotidyltransferase with HDIG domain